MKIGGVEVTKCEEILVLPRGDGNDIPIRAQAVAINKEFDEKVPLPTAPLLQTKDGQKRDYKDKEYRKALNLRSDMRFAYMCLRSLEPSNIEWQTVDLDRPSTWMKWQDELQEAGISEVEINRIIGAIMAANALDEEKIKAAREVFLRGQGA